MSLALFTTAQVELIAEALREGAPSCISVFAGRIADAGIDPLEIMARSVEIIEATAERGELIWASPREVLNVVQASNVGCHIITVTPDLLAKLPRWARTSTGSRSRPCRCSAATRSPAASICNRL